MKIVRFSTGSKTQYGLLEGTTIRGLKTSPFDEGWDKKNPNMDGTSYTLNKISLLPPCVPTKYIGVGTNYRPQPGDPIRPDGPPPAPLPDKPILFFKPLTAVVGPGEEVIFPAEVEAAVAYEGELGVVIGKKCKNVKEKDALNYVIGYTCANDVTDTSKFRIDNGKDFRAKSVDTFGPIGPCISTDVDPMNAVVRSWINGEQRQNGNSKNMLFNVPYLISYLSVFMTLMPGDVIATGTPAGAGGVKVGDVAKVEIEGIGALENKFVSHR